MLDQGLLRPIDEVVAEMLGAGLETLDLSNIDTVDYLEKSHRW